MGFSFGKLMFFLLTVLSMGMSCYSGCGELLSEVVGIVERNATGEEGTQGLGDREEEVSALRYTFTTSGTEDCGHETVIYRPSVTIRQAVVGAGATEDGLAPGDETCGCSIAGVKDDISAEMARVMETYANDAGETTRQVQQLLATLSDIADILNTETDESTPSPPLTTSSSGILAKDCLDALSSGKVTSGVYTVHLQDDGEPVQVYCDMETDGGGWTVFQRRQDGTEDFYRDFEIYHRGFGSPDGEFWLGNDNLHRMTAQDDYELRIDLMDFQGNAAYAKYNSFGVSDLWDYYRLTVGNYTGTAGDSLSVHNGKRFSTKDRDNDDWMGNCAQQFRGAWWYSACYKSHLNGRYSGEPYQGIAWYAWKGNYDSLKMSEMKFRKY